MTATYSGSTTPAFASSTGTATVSVAPLATTTALNSSTLSPVAGVNVTLSANVTDAEGVTPIGTVAFYNGTTNLGSAALNSSGTASLSISLPQGAASLTAEYAGGNGFVTSTSTPPLSLVVAAPPAATTTALSASTTTPSTGQPVTFTATVTNTASGTTGTPEGQVTFQAGSTVLGSGNLNANGVATLTTTFPNAGTDTITAIYQGNSSYTGSTSSSVTVTVSQALAASTTSLTLSSSGIQQGQNVTFTATVASASPSVTITPTETSHLLQRNHLAWPGNLVRRHRHLLVRDSQSRQLFGNRSFMEATPTSRVLLRQPWH